ncbi:MAG: aldehyde dehydrogenase family protein [Actinomycetota bacterium]|nr:aldehyde dehydrogenase family protein [Actinomycetota bacterium]MDP1876927.1 aldehyde dehydrogenase family protein [Actinomycetota bacterium]
MTQTLSDGLLIDRMARTVDGVRMFIGGEWQSAESGATFDTVDPSTGRVIASVPRAGSIDVDRAVKAAADAAVAWQFTDALTRAALLRQLGALVVENVDELAWLEALDSGHYIDKARDLVMALPLWLDYHAGLANIVGGRTIPVPGDKLSFTLLEPLGVTAHIVPWNYPLLVMARSIAPALALGNTVVVKPAEQTPLTALYFARLVEEAGFPTGVFNVVTGFGEEAGAPLAAHPDVAGITFTGSTETGRIVAKLGADHIAQVNLELGGKSPVIVFPDAKIDDAVEATIQGFCSHAGQVCIAGSRLFLHDAIRDEFLGKLTQRLESVRIGDSFESRTQFGPLVSSEQLDRVLSYIDIGKSEATLYYGGGRPSGVADGGYFVEPTVFIDVAPTARIAREEIFGPVLSVLGWSDVDDLVRQANDSQFGLFAAIWTQDLRDALSTARRLQVGGVVINDWFGELPMAPHGGHKQSGTGREEGLETVQGYTQVKHVCINLSDSLVDTSDWAAAPL